MGTYQTFRGDPEKKLFYLLENFMGGINTEFSDDASPDVDFDSIINFDMDKLGTLNKRNGFGELLAISQIFNTLDESYLPELRNRTESLQNPEYDNDNIVYMKLLKNENNCFRNLSGFSGEKAYREYQKNYGFQNNHFELLLITTRLDDNGVPTSSKGWLYKCYLPELDYDPETGEIIDTMEINCYTTTFPIIFNWDRNLLNMDSVEYFDKIWFTNNDKALVCFDRSVNISSNSAFSNAFTYTGSITGVTNSAYKPSTIETSMEGLGPNLLCTNPLYDISIVPNLNESLQGITISTEDNRFITDYIIPTSQPLLMSILYSGSSNFAITAKCGGEDVGLTATLVSSLSTTNHAVYKIVFLNTPNGEVEFKVEKTGVTNIEPIYAYYKTGQLNPEFEPVVSENVGDFKICIANNRIMFYKEDTIYFSDINIMNYIPCNNYVKFPIEPTDEITKICYFKGVYIVFTKEQIFKLKGTFGTSDFAVEPVNTSLGCHAGETVVPIEDTLYFASPRGIYALKSSTFVEGMQNLKELDIKVKKLTSDYTLYDVQLNQPTIRFNGISERAYAFRYKDKYILFYNNYNDKGDYAARNDLDAITYQYDVGAFTTYRFKEKPTFLFMVDNAIETFCTIQEDQLYETPDTLLEYDFTTLTSTTVEDQSGNNYDGKIVGIDEISSAKGISFNSDYSKSNAVVDNINYNNGLDFKIDIESIDEITLPFPIIPLFYIENQPYTFDKINKTISGSSSIKIGSPFNDRVELNALLDCELKQLSQTSVYVSPKLKLKVNKSSLNNGNLVYKLEGNNEVFIEGNISDIQFNSNLEYEIDLSKFSINTDDKTNYFDSWKLSIQYIPTYYYPSVTFNITTYGVFNGKLINYLYDDVPYYQLLAEIGPLDKKLHINFSYIENYELVNNVTQNYEFISKSDIDFTSIKRHLINIKFIKEGNFLRVNYVLDNNQTEDLGYIPISFLSVITSSGKNNYELGSQQGISRYCNIYYSYMNIDNKNIQYNFTEGEGNVCYDVNGKYNLVTENCVWVSASSGLTFDGENVYVELPNLSGDLKFTQGFSIEFEGSFKDNGSTKIFDIATAYNNDNEANKNASINCSLVDNELIFTSNSTTYKSYSLKAPVIMDINHKHKFDFLYKLNGNYELNYYVDDDPTPISTININGGVSNVTRLSNFIGKSNNTKDNLFKGTLKNFKITLYEGDEPTYRNGIFEFDTASTDFGKPMYVELITKAINMKYPQHMKKLKHIFVKAIGGNNYDEFFFQLYADGHAVNDPRKYFAYLDENGTLVYDFTGEKLLTLDEIKSILGNIRLGTTKLGEGKYQTKKLIIPKKAKNFSCHIYGDTIDYLSLESLGFVCKLGKVKEG